MLKKITYTLGKTERLKSRKLIDELFESGKSFSIFPFRIIYKKSRAEETPAILQAAFSVSKRHFKKAVDRNRIKRLMREAYRLQKNVLQASLDEHNKHLHVFLLYTGNELPEYDLVFSKMGLIIKRFLKVLNEEVDANT